MNAPPARPSRVTARWTEPNWSGNSRPFTIEQAGQTLGISLVSARVHYERGKKRLCALLEDEER
jgi:hypothetical protein